MDVVPLGPPAFSPLSLVLDVRYRDQYVAPGKLGALKSAEHAPRGA